MLGKEYELAGVKKPENEFMELKAIVEKGLTCKIGGWIGYDRQSEVSLYIPERYRRSR